MRICESLLLILGLGVVAFGCGTNTGSGLPHNQVHFGPGSAPNSNSFTGQGGLGGGPGSFATVSPMTTGRAGHTATILPNGNLLVVAGIGDTTQTGTLGAPFHVDAELYDVANDAWSVVSNASPTVNAGRLMDPTDAFATGRAEHTAVSLTTGAVMIAGGVGVQQFVGGQPVVEAMNTCYVFSPSNNTFTRQNPMPQPRYFHLAHLLSDGNVIVTAGFDKFQVPPPPSTTALQSADIFQTGTGNWAPVGGVPGGQAMASGHTWGNIMQFKQDVLVVNGCRVDNLFSTQQPPPQVNVYGWPPGVFFPNAPGSTGSFSSGGELYNTLNGSFGNGPAPLREPTPSGVVLGGGVTLSTGDVFFAGGENFGPPNNQARFVGAIPTTELLEAATGSFKAGPNIGSSDPPPAQGGNPLPVPLTEVHCVEISTSADVLIVAGSGPNGATNPRCEVWSFFNNVMIVPTPPQGQPYVPLMLNTARRNFRLTAIPNQSQALVTGGWDVDQQGNIVYLSSVEFYSR